MSLSSQIRLFRRNKFGRVSRASFWLTTLAYPVVLLAAFCVPFEVLYRMGCEPDSVELKVFMWSEMILFFTAFVCWMRLMRLRLHDTGRSGAWCLLTAVPVLGWAVLLWMLTRPASSAGDRFELL